MTPTIAAVVLASGLAFAPSTVAAQTTPRLLYERAQAHERTVRDTNDPTLLQLRSAVARYEALVRLRAHAYASGRSATDVARDSLERRLLVEAD